MGLKEEDLLEEWFAPRREAGWVPLSGGMESFSYFEDPLASDSSGLSFQDLLSATPPISIVDFAANTPFSDLHIPITELEECSHLELYSPLLMEEFIPANTNFTSNVAHGQQSDPSICAGNRKIRVKRLAGQPSKNLMAERRRRKRLNDRLSMLRSIVPKISKMDRTSILGDTIDYVKELLQRIHNLQGEDGDVLQGRTVKQCERVVRNSPKFEVERKDVGTRVEMYCAPKPGLLLSTVSTMEALGLEIRECVVSCFSDFSMAASCSEEPQGFNTEDVKQALIRNAGYGGRCL